MTAPATPAAQAPRTIVYAAIALLVTGLFGVIAALTEFSGSTKSWLFDETKKADLKSTDVKSGKKAMPTDAQIRHTIDSSTTPVLVISLVVLAVLAYVAYSLWKGKYWTRWSVVGVFVLLTFFTGSPGGGLNGLLLVTSSTVPATLKYTAFISSLAMLAGVVLTNMRPSVDYLALTRPPRKPRAGAGAGGGLFGPRPAGGGGLFGPRPTSADPAAKGTPPARSATKAATTRPATGKSGPAPAATGKSRGKSRVDVTARDSATRPRGKSRRSSTDGEVG